MADYTRLLVWQRAHLLAKGVYTMVRDMPRSDRGDLGNQLRRAALSIPTNIAEGCGRNESGDLRRYLRIALGSAAEVNYLLTFGREMEILPLHPADRLLDEVQQLRRMLGAFTLRLTPPQKGNRGARAASRPDS